MNKNLSRFLFILLFLVTSVVAVACGGANSDNNNEGAANDPNNNNDGAGDGTEEITIKWAHPWGDDHIEENIREVIEDEFPHVTIEHSELDVGHPDTIEEEIAAQNIPDVVTLITVSGVDVLDEYQLAYDMGPLIEETGFDLDRLEPSIVEYVRNQDPNMEGGLYAIPENRPTWALHYNKDVFDILGVDYPENDLTWEEVYELAKDLTREVDGVQYRGLDLDLPDDAFTQFSVNTVDPETDEPMIAESEEVRRYLQYIKDVVSIPGNYPTEEPGSLLHNWGSLMEEGEIAMAPAKTNGPWMTDMPNVDIATYPVWEGYENLNPVPNARGIAITDQNEHKEETLKVIEYLLSDEVQLARSKQGGESILVDPDIHAVFAEENSDLDGKNLDALFMNEYATGPEKRPKYSSGVMWTAPIDFVDSGEDINVFLRMLQEEAEENIRSQKETE